ncbi:MAG: hypothetical protein ACRDJW_21330 [Thermomicrobiales bacterium]
MGRTRFSTWMLIIGLFAIGVLAVAPATPAMAAHTAKITIHKAVCDSNVQDIFGKCHDNRLKGVWFRVAGVWRQTNSNGEVSWGPGAGTKTIVEDSATFNKYGAAYVFCSNQVTGRVLFDGLRTVNWVTIQTTAGQPVICDWYNLT